MVSIIALLKKFHELGSDDMAFMESYLKNMRQSLEKELETRTRQKKGKKDVMAALESLDRFESVISYLLTLNQCNIESLVSQAEDMNSSIEITKLYELTSKVRGQVEELLNHQLEATKVFNSRWYSSRMLTQKERRNELVYKLWREGKNVTEIKTEVDRQMAAEGVSKGIGRQTIYDLIERFKKTAQ